MIMTTNMSKVFNDVLKGARSLPITALIDWHQMSHTLLMLMLRLRPVWLRLGQWK